MLQFIIIKNPALSVIQFSNNTSHAFEQNFKCKIKENAIIIYMYYVTLFFNYVKYASEKRVINNKKSKYILLFAFSVFKC